MTEGSMINKKNLIQINSYKKYNRNKSIVRFKYFLIFKIGMQLTISNVS